MKILIITDYYQLTNGVGVYINTLNDLLIKAGHSVLIVVLSAKEVFNQPNLRLIIPTPLSNKYWWFFCQNIIDFKLYKKLHCQINDFKPDLIHLQAIKQATKTILLACRGFKKIQTLHNFSLISPPPVINSRKNNYDLCLGRNRLKCYHRAGLKWRTIFLDYFLFNNLWLSKKMIKYFICPSKKLADLCRQRGLKSVIYLPHFSPFIPKDQINFESNHILFVGRLGRVKGVDYLLSAFKLVLAKNRSLKLVIVGDGPEKTNLIKLAKDLGILNQVNFVGAVDREHLPAYYQNCLAVVIPSVWQEMFGLVALEAMTFSKPVIANNVGGLPELVKDGDNGFLVERFNTQQLADRILLLAGNRQLASELGQNGQQFLRDNFDEQGHLERILGIYNLVING